MKLIFKNKIYRILTLSQLLNSMGSSLYNIVFIIYAATMFHSKLMISFANIVMMVPTVFTVFIGIKADNTQDKSKFLILSGFTQALFFTIVSLIINESTLLVFSTVSLFNIISDMLSDYSNGLRLPIIQKNIAQDDLFEAYSFTQFITYLCHLAGQVIGVWLLTVSKYNFSWIALINALSFLVSVCLLLPIKQELTHEKGAINTSSHSLFKQLSDLFYQVKLIFSESQTERFLSLLSAILLLNMLGGAITAIYNIFLLNQPLFHFSYGQSLLVVEAVLVGGILLGSVTPHDYFSTLSIEQLLRLAASVFTLVGLSNVLSFPAIIGLLLLAFATYLSGKVNPKINSLLLTNLPSTHLARTSNFLSMLFTLSIPIGVAGFSMIASLNMTVTWVVFTILAMIILLLVLKK